MDGGGDRASDRDVSYVLPRHPTEVDRLDVQHYALREALGANYLAPVQRPALVLDVGAGTGQWAYELCAEFPEAQVVGLDLEPSKPGAPANYRGIRANLLEGLPFGDGQINFVHQRLLFSGVPVKAWAAVVTDLARVCRPGGWIELVEGDTELRPASPATGRLAELFRRLSRIRGLDSTGIVFSSLDRYLTRAGVTAVERHNVALPLGEWGGRIGSLMASDFRALFTRLAPVFAAALGVSPEECGELVREAREEWERDQTTYSIAVAFGQKPN
jgi:SAM-dependent methyltransferase